MRTIGWYYDAREPTIAQYWDGTKFLRTKQLVDVGLEPLYDMQTGQQFPDYDRPTGAVQVFNEWKRSELREAARRQAAGEPPPRIRRKGLGCFPIVALIVIGFTLFGACSPSSASGSAAGAEAVCQQFIETRLKSPASAEFSSTDVVELGDTYKVTAVVDAQNSFGAMMRSSWTCRVIWNDASEKYTLDLLEQR
ncbi:hypothetical protein [Arthrobacter zhaoguopingii]|uniref:hypothetical protein n=1 Tax=Arthrobacter zhaoguopingii TaxID=2681491 RepID=UPI00135A16A2|nr:hypothetical protein [Arthrobacter zhaoguopingii]